MLTMHAWYNLCIQSNDVMMLRYKLYWSMFCGKNAWLHCTNWMLNKWWLKVKSVISDFFDFQQQMQEWKLVIKEAYILQDSI